jgi:hypothetical protein
MCLLIMAVQMRNVLQNGKEGFWLASCSGLLTVASPLGSRSIGQCSNSRNKLFVVNVESHTILRQGGGWVVYCSV